MAPYKTKRSVNAVELLNRRSRGTRDALSRYNLKVFRGVLLQDTRVFLKVWSKTSKSKIMYENGKFYFENYQICYSCVHSDPHVLYKLPKRSKKEKLEDALLCQSPLDKTLASPSDQKPSLLALTANNWLCRLSVDTGKELQKVYLSPNLKFKYLGWDISPEIFYVKTVQSKETSLERQAGIVNNTIMHIAIFQAFPLQIVGIMEINKRVFGNGITDVVLSQGVLAVSYSNKSVKLYSCEHIFQRQSSLLRGKTVGEFPFGIPVNIQIKDCPPVLFEVSCSNNGVQVGGFPWHYIYTPPQKNHKGTHHIRSLKDNIMATNGIQNMNCCSLESDMIFFHPDDSGRIIHFGPNTINGKLLRTVELAERWDETYRHELFFDKDTIVHIEQQNTNFCCHVYKLEGLEEYAE
uniref:DDB1 and CUL4 associated factor 17 n=1 Tax=Sphaeramia orbicularis TaxID=375764 RepID=A0A672Z459_9TELE